MPKIVDHDKVRAVFLSQSFQFFADRGYRGVSMRGLAKHLNTTTGTLYHYFEHKADLFTQMLAYLAVGDVDEFVDKLDGNLSGSERMRALMMYITEREEYFRRMIFLFCTLYQEPEALQYLARDGGDGVEKVRQMFQRMVNTYLDAFVGKLGFSPKASRAVFSFFVGHLLVQVFSEGLDESMQMMDQFEPLGALLSLK